MFYEFTDPLLKLTTFETLAKIGTLESFLLNVGLGFIAKSEHVWRGNVGIGRWLFVRSITRTKMILRRNYSNLYFWPFSGVGGKLRLISDSQILSGISVTDVKVLPNNGWKPASSSTVEDEELASEISGRDWTGGFWCRT